MNLDRRLKALESRGPADGRPVLTLATWRAEHDRTDFLDRWPIVAMRRAAAREAEQLAGVQDGQED